MTNKIKYIGCDDPELELFESQYDLPEGMCYNSFVILDEKVAVMDSVDKRKTDEWLDKLEKALDGRPSMAASPTTSSPSITSPTTVVRWAHSVPAIPRLSSWLLPRPCSLLHSSTRSSTLLAPRP